MTNDHADERPRDYWAIALVIIAALLGGHMEPLLANVDHLQNSPETMAALTILLLKLLQSVLFSAVSYLAKLAIDHYIRPRLFKKRDEQQEKNSNSSLNQNTNERT